MKPLTVADVETWPKRRLRNGSPVWCCYCHTAINPKQEYRAKWHYFVHERCLEVMRAGSEKTTKALEDLHSAEAILKEILRGKVYE